jgi:hypothetical protein
LPSGDIAMQCAPKAFISHFVPVVVFFLLASVQLSIAEDKGGRDIMAAYAYRYAQYYVPYAIQSAAAYAPVTELDARRGQWNESGYRADAEYAVQSAVLGSDEQLRGHARQVFKPWRYRFGSDSYLTCIDPSDRECQAEFLNRGRAFSSGPAFQIWTRARSQNDRRDECSEVSIAFRGTVGSLFGDSWFSNYDRFGSPYDDYYHQLRRNVEGIMKMIQNLDCYKLARTKPQIVSTGHSLGAGMAQFAALATKSSRARIAKVFAFDSSPVTGAHLLAKPLREGNASGLTIDHIYETGEILSYTRRTFVQQYPSLKSRCDPLVRTVEVKAARGTLIGLHGIPLLATNLVDLSYGDGQPSSYRPPLTRVGNCDVRYQPPSFQGGEEDEAIVAAAPGRLAVSVARSHGRNIDQSVALVTADSLRSGSLTKRGARVALGRQAGRAAAMSAYALAAGEAAAFTPIQRAE